MREQVILDNEKYRVVYKRCEYDEDDLEQYSEDAEHGFDLPDLVRDLVESTKPYALWLCWLSTIKNIGTLREESELRQFLARRDASVLPGTLA